MNNFTYKQVEVLNRVVTLIENGADITKLTTSEIAARAGISKSTLFDRFADKNRLLEGAVEYILGTKLKTDVDDIFSRQSCKEKFYSLLEKFDDMQSGKSNVVTSIIKSYGGVENIIQKYRVKYGEEVARILAKVTDDVMNDIISAGKAEKIIRGELTYRYTKQVLYSAVASIRICPICAENRENVKENAFNIFVKSLN